MGRLVTRDAGETELSVLGRMAVMCAAVGEWQPILMMRKLKNVTFGQVLDRGQWSAEKTEVSSGKYGLGLESSRGTRAPDARVLWSSSASVRVGRCRQSGTAAPRSPCPYAVEPLGLLIRLRLPRHHAL